MLWIHVEGCIVYTYTHYTIYWCYIAISYSRNMYYTCIIIFFAKNVMKSDRCLIGIFTHFCAHLPSSENVRLFAVCLIATHIHPHTHLIAWSQKKIDSDTLALCYLACTRRVVGLSGPTTWSLRSEHQHCSTVGNVRPFSVVSFDLIRAKDADSINTKHKVASVHSMRSYSNTN